MSDFDKEAERERLREKYERDQQKREASERMSDLLLKGATMTNAHCNNCGDPIFRYDGEEFCPTCQQVVTDDAAGDAADGDDRADAADDASGEGDDTAGESAAVEENGTDAENGDAPDHIEIKQPDGPAVQTGDQSESSAGVADQPESSPDVADQPESPSAGGQSASPSAGGEPSTAATDEPAADVSGTDSAPSAANSGSASGQGQPGQRQSRGTPPGAGETPSPAAAGDDFESARASLVRTLRAHAEQAEHCEDPRRARDHLAAAREAAEALSALSSSY